MLCKTLRALQMKKNTAATFLGQAGKTGSEEKWGQVAMEYIYEKVQTNDPKKRAAEVAQERAMATAFDRYTARNELVFEERLARLTARQIEAMEAIPEPLLDEALLLNSEQPPLNFSRPSLTPPIPGFEPGYGIDVPQLRTEYPEFPKMVRPTDHIEFGAEPEAEFPFVDPNAMLSFTTKYADRLESMHGQIRKEAIASGPEGEQWEAYAALNKKAVARQRLILELSADPELKEQYDSDEAFRAEELQRRGIVDLATEDDSSLTAAERLSKAPNVPREAAPIHYAQEAKYQPIRKI